MTFADPRSLSNVLAAQGPAACKALGSCSDRLGQRTCDHRRIITCGTAEGDGVGLLPESGADVVIDARLLGSVPPHIVILEDR